MIPAIISTEAIGTATSPTIFDDFKDVGRWPAHQNIRKITRIEFWHDENRIHAIRITYLKKDGETEIKSHGNLTGTRQDLPLSANEFLVGVSGTTLIANKTLKRLGFLFYNKNTGTLTSHGPFPPTPSPPSPIETGFASLGLTKAFGGTLDLSGALDALSMFKAYGSEGGLLELGIEG